MCGVGCNCVSCTPLMVGEPRLLKLTEPIHYNIDAGGQITIDPTTHTVVNGDVASTTAEEPRLRLTFRLDLPSYIGCSKIIFSDADDLPSLAIRIDNRTNPVYIQNANRDHNVVTYSITMPSLDQGVHKITGVILGQQSSTSPDLPFGSVKLGCNQSSRCQIVPTSLWLIKSEALPTPP
jgi:hypothetical protein